MMCASPKVRVGWNLGSPWIVTHGSSPRFVDTTDPIEEASRRELELEFHRAISRLSPKLLTIVVLRYSENLTYEEVAETLRISVGTVKSRLARAHEALDRELTPVLDRMYFGHRG